jgi:signal transduction histidine kinase
VIDAEALRHFSFFASFPAEQLRRVAERLPIVSSAANSTVFAMGDVSASMYLILQGQVKIHRTGEKGEAVELGTLGPNQTFGELAMLSREPRMATVTALTDSRFLVMERPLLLDMLRDAPPEAILDMFAVLSRQIRAANEGDFRKLLASRTLESQMEVEKQRGLTQMVAGVAHEINTPLGVAGTAASIVARELDKLEPLAVDRKSQSALADSREALGLLTGNLERAHKLVQDFKKVSVSQLSDEKEPLDLPQAIRDTLNLAQVSLKRSQVTVVFNHTLPPEAHTWVGYRGYLSQILLNLLANVERYAYPAGQGGAAEVALALAGPGEYELRVKDFGRGIPPGNLDRVFEPFFTTGRGAGGTGLGMTIVYNLVTTALKGRITLHSVVAQGTDVQIVFPRVIPD